MMPVPNPVAFAVAAPAPRLRRPLPRRQGGVALIEALLAVLILAIGLLGSIGLQARAYSALSDASMRAEATMATDKLFGMMSNDVANLASYAVTVTGTPSSQLAPWYAQTVANLTNDASTTHISVAVTPSADLSRTEVLVTLTWQRKGGPVGKHVVTSYIAAAT